MTSGETKLAHEMANCITLLTVEQAKRHNRSDAAFGLLRRKLLGKIPLVFGTRGFTGRLATHHHGREPDKTLADQIAGMGEHRRYDWPQIIETYFPTEKLFAIYGDNARKHGNPFCYLHDYYVTETYFSLPWDERRQWLYEPKPDGGLKKFEKLPDAALITSSGTIRLYIEIIGTSYTRARVVELMELSNEKGISIAFY